MLRNISQHNEMPRNSSVLILMSQPIEPKKILRKTTKTKRKSNLLSTRCCIIIKSVIRRRAINSFLLLKERDHMIYSRQEQRRKR